METGISDEKLQKKIGFEPFEGQQQVIDCDSDEIVLCCGRRWGKTTLSAYLGLKELILPKRKIWIVAPSYDLTKRVFDKIVSWLADVFPPEENMWESKTRPHPQIQTSWGAQLEGKSTENPKGLLGEELDMIIMDEAAQVSKRVWESYIYPTTHDRNATAIFISTPTGKNWFYRRWQEAKEKGGAFQFRSLDRPSFDKEEWIKAQKRVPRDVFNEMYKAQFVDAASSVFRQDDIDKITMSGDYEIGENEQFTIGVDLAKQNDFFAAAVISHETYRVIDIFRKQSESYPHQKDLVKNLSEEYNNAKIVIDASGLGDPVYDDLFESGVFVEDFKFTGPSKRRLIDKLRIYIEQEKITIPDNSTLIEEMGSFQAEETKSGNTRYSAPEGAHDDMVIALALAVWDLDIKEPEQKNEMKRQLEEGAREMRSRQNSFI